MTKTNTNKNNQKNRTDTRKRMSTAAILLSAVALISSSALASVHSISVFAAAPTNSSSSMTNINYTNYTKTLDHMLVQNLTKTNVPVTLPLTRGYVNGFEVFYISTEASDKGLADHLTNLTHSRVSFAPALKNAPPQSLANIYVFQNGIKGSGPLGFQPNVADSQPGDPGYSPLWRISNVEWKQGASPKELKSETDILSAQKNGELTISSSD
ncbi:MAG: hypothetical protein WA364_13150, partial [Candidatus Nitrosopolaris sp.]